MWAGDNAGAFDAAVLDVGSNSVRLVIYRVEGRAIWSLFNEKVSAGLGRGVEQTGLLDPDGVEAALTALRRFRAVLDAVRPLHIYSAATAAVREAADGQAFIERVKVEAGMWLEEVGPHPPWKWYPTPLWLWRGQADPCVLLLGSKWIR